MKFGYKTYISQINNYATRTEVARFRLSSHRLMIEIGRQFNIKRKDRLCPKCDRKEIEDENHFLMESPAYANERSRLLGSVLEKSKLFGNLAAAINHRNIENIKAI